MPRWDHEDPDDPYDLAELDLRLVVYRVAGSGVVVWHTQVPDWHARRVRSGGRDAIRAFGQYGDHEWAETWWPDPRYL
jgi:hypothetical protein